MALTGSLDKKYLIKDQFSPDYHIARWKAIFYLLIAVAIGSLSGFIILLFRRNSTTGSGFGRARALGRDVRRVGLTVSPRGGGDLRIDLASKYDRKTKQK
jgi:hypothetical protein